jgi:hypothetical protein
MHRVICDCCRRRGHLRRDCPFSSRALQTTLSDAFVEGLKRLSFVEIDEDEDDPAKSRRRRKRRQKSAAPSASKLRVNPDREARYAGRYAASTVEAEAARQQRCEPAWTGVAAALRREAGVPWSPRCRRARVDQAGETLRAKPVQPQSLVARKGDTISKAIVAEYGRREPR